MDLYLVQHGRAEPADVDPDRPLTETGRQEVEVVAHALLGLVKVSGVRHSGKLRARQTAEILASVLGVGASRLEGLAPQDDPGATAAWAASCESGTMLVGHLPHLARVTSALVTGDAEETIVDFRNGGVVCLRRRDGAWSLSWIVTPEVCRR